MSAYLISELYEFTPQVGLTNPARPNPLHEQVLLTRQNLLICALLARRSRVGV